MLMIVVEIAVADAVVVAAVLEDGFDAEQTVLLL